MKKPDVKTDLNFQFKIDILSNTHETDYSKKNLRKVPTEVKENIIKPALKHSGVKESDLPMIFDFYIPIKLWVEDFEPRERQTRDYPGSPPRVDYYVEFKEVDIDSEPISDWKQMPWNVCEFFDKKLQEIGLSYIEEKAQLSYDAYIDGKIHSDYSGPVKKYKSPTR